ncbi:MAG: hypothetical protein WCS27_15065 [Victivallaceae bacterium]|jgi:hypothetical protein
MKRMPDKYYPLLKVNGQDIGMNVHLYNDRRYWNFYCYPDPRLDEPYIEKVFTYLCEIDGFMYSLDRAFHRFLKVAYSGEGTLMISAMWLSGELLTRDHMMYILEQAALPHWLKAGKTIENWIGDRKWGPKTLRKMCNEIYNSRQNSLCHAQYMAWIEKCSRMRENHADNQHE